MSIRQQLVAVGMAFGIAASASAGGLGEKAPGLHVQEWIKGEPVAMSKGIGKDIYVLEFWLTTCPAQSRVYPVFEPVAERLSGPKRGRAVDFARIGRDTQNRLWKIKARKSDIESGAIGMFQRSQPISGWLELRRSRWHL